MDGRSVPVKASTSTYYVDGAEIRWSPTVPRYAGAALIEALGDGSARLPGREDPPYLFCANGSCRDCNLLVDGIPDVASCRLFLAPGMSFRSGDGAGEENALSRRLGPARAGSPLVADVVVVGAGPAGRAAAEAARETGAETLLLEARVDFVEGASSLHSVGVASGEPFVLEGGTKRVLSAGSFVLANGARDTDPRVPGATLAGVLPLALLARYAAHGRAPGGSILVAGRTDVSEGRLREIGASSCTLLPDVGDLLEVTGRNRVEGARVHGRAGEPDVELAVDVVFVGRRREPALELARGLGCRSVYDPELGYDRLVTDDDGATSVPGLFACGDVVRIGTRADAEASGRLAGRAAASRSGVRRSEC